MEGQGTDTTKMDHIRRVDHLEGEVSGLKTSVAGIDQKIGLIDRKLAAQETRSLHSEQLLQDIAGKLDGVRSQKTDWNLVAAGVGLVVVLLAAVLAPLYQYTLENKSSVASIKESQWSRSEDRQVMEWFRSENTQKINDIKSTLRIQDERIRDLEIKRSGEG